MSRKPRKTVPPAETKPRVRDRIRSVLVLRDEALAKLPNTWSGEVGPFGLMPEVPTQVLRAFAAVGVVEPYCQFVRRDPWSRQQQEELSAIIRSIPDDAPDTVEQRIAESNRWESKKWWLLDEHETTWTRVVVARGVSVSSAGFADRPRRYGTGVGRVEQWLTLSHMFRAELAAFRDKRNTEPGFLLSGDEPGGNDLVIGVSAGPPVMGVCSRRLLWKRGRTADGIDGDERILTTAGTAVLVWAVAHQRLMSMYDDVRDMATRLQLRQIASYLTRRKPVLSWTEEDFSLERAVRAELIAAAPIWKGSQKEPIETDAPPPSADVALTNDHELILAVFGGQKRTKFISVNGVASAGSIRNRETVGRLLAELKGLGMVDRPFGPRKGYALTDAGRKRLADMTAT